MSVRRPQHVEQGRVAIGVAVGGDALVDLEHVVDSQGTSQLGQRGNISAGVDPPLNATVAAPRRDTALRSCRATQCRRFVAPRSADRERRRCPSHPAIGEPGEELDDRGGECVVLVAGDHVMGIADIDELGVRYQREELGGGLEAQDVTAPAAYEEHGQVQVPGERLEDVGIDPSSRSVATHRPRIPVPPVPPVVTES